MRGCWNDTTVLPDLRRDKQALNSVVGEVAGEDVAEANAGATAKVQRGILVDCLTGSNGRAKAENWFPKWFAFPPSGYTERGGIGCVESHPRIAPRLVPAITETQTALRAPARLKFGLTWGIGSVRSLQK